MDTLKQLGKNIALYRKKSSITQEHLAELLHVSVSAVSQWETGKTLPDISVIPILCHVLNVTSDELMGIDQEKNEAEIREILKEANQLMDRHHLSKAEKMLRNTLKRFPNRFDVMEALMYLYFSRINDYEDTPEGKSKREADLREAIFHARKIAQDCPEDERCVSAKQILCLSYSDLGENEKAMEIAEKMPYMACSREQLQLLASTGRKRLEYQQGFFFMLLQNLCNSLNFANVRFEDGTYAYTFEEEAAIAQKSIDLLHLMFEDQDFGFFHELLSLAHKHIARFYASLKNREKTLTELKEAVAHAEALLDYDPCEKHTSLIVRGREYGTFRTNTEENPTLSTLNDLKNERFDFLRDDPEFLDLTERLRATAGKWK